MHTDHRQEGKIDDDRILSTDEGDIAVEEYATIFKVKDDQQKLIEFADIKIDDEITAYGIDACPNDSPTVFHAFVLFINQSESSGDDDDDDDDDAT